MSGPRRVTICELPNEPTELARAWQRLVDHVEGARSDLLLLPEMPFAPWLAAQPEPHAARWDEAVADHRRWAGRLPAVGLPVLFTAPVVEDGRRFNRDFASGPDGLVPLHDKYYLPDGEGY